MFYSRIKRGRKLTNKRRVKRIRYDQALEALKVYQNNELRILTVIDNNIFPEKSVSHVCQIPSCSQRIRYEYVMENKNNNEKLIVGSTCVWELLGLSQEEIKSFTKVENSIKDYHRKIKWERENPDVCDKIVKLKENKVNFFRPFWEEIGYAPLDDEDTNYIRGLDVDDVIYKESQKLLAVQIAVESNRNRIINKSAPTPDNYDDAINGLKQLSIAFPSNSFYASLLSWVENGRVLSKAQIACIEKDIINKLKTQLVS